MIKKIEVFLPEYILEDIDRVQKESNEPRDKTIRELIIIGLEQKRSKGQDKKTDTLKEYINFPRSGGGK